MQAFHEKPYIRFKVSLAPCGSHSPGLNFMHPTLFTILGVFMQPTFLATLGVTIAPHVGRGVGHTLFAVCHKGENIEAS